MTDIKTLREKTAEMVMVLDENKAEEWATYFAKALEKLSYSDTNGAKDIIEAYSGRNSFNEFTLGDKEAEQKRQRISSEMYILAQTVWRECA